MTGVTQQPTQESTPVKEATVKTETQTEAPPEKPAPEPVESAPTEVTPAPSESIPAELAPSESIVVEPVPSEPVPAEPSPPEPAPSEPTHSEALPSEAASSEPAPPEPAASESVPSEPAPVAEPITSAETVATAESAPAPESYSTEATSEQNLAPEQAVVEISAQQAEPVQMQTQPDQPHAVPVQVTPPQPHQQPHPHVRYVPPPVSDHQYTQEQSRSQRQRRQRPPGHEIPISQVVQGVSSLPPEDGGPVAVLRSGINPSEDSPAVVYGGHIKEVSYQPVAPPERKAYQTFDMSGGRYYQPAAQKQQQHNYHFNTVQGRPFEDQPRGFRPVAQPPPQPIPQPMQRPPQTMLPPQQMHPDPQPMQAQPQYAPEQPIGYQHVEPPLREYEEPNLTQSRTFKVLESLMSSEEPYSGVQGLPKQRTKSGEQWKAEQEAKRGSSARVKVFMPQQYNSPLGMYSARNVVETFQAQAETVMESMERPPPEDYNNMSAVQRALLEG